MAVEILEAIVRDKMQWKKYWLENVILTSQHLCGSSQMKKCLTLV